MLNGWGCGLPSYSFWGKQFIGNIQAQGASWAKTWGQESRVCRNWEQAGQPVPKLKAGMRWGLGYKEVKSGLPPLP